MADKGKGKLPAEESSSFTRRHRREMAATDTQFMASARTAARTARAPRSSMTAEEQEEKDLFTTQLMSMMGTFEQLAKNPSMQKLLKTKDYRTGSQAETSQQATSRQRQVTEPVERVPTVVTGPVQHVTQAQDLARNGHRSNEQSTHPTIPMYTSFPRHFGGGSVLQSMIRPSPRFQGYMPSTGNPMYDNIGVQPGFQIVPGSLGMAGTDLGKVYLYGLGNWIRLVLGDPELCKEVLYNKLGHYPKSELLRPELQDLLADGLVALEGEKWAQHRRIVNPAFYMEKLKEMTPTIIGLVASMLDAWQAKLELASGQVEVDVRKEFNTLTADIIAHTAFGSSYAEGKQVFELQYEQQRIFGQLLGTIGIPGSRFLPTTFNKHRWRLSKQINSILTGIIQKRLGVTESGSKTALKDDLLGLMLAASKEESKGSHEKMKLTLQDIVAECKTFFFAGHETTSSLLTWAVFLLSIYPEWQERARDEVKDLFGTYHPDAEALSKMKVVGMILHETLRLYPPVVIILRKASKSLKLRDLEIQKGTTLLIPISLLHTDPTFWGSDAQEFNPERFANGMLKACSHPVAFLPFSLGPRNCVGQNFAMIEAKVALCMVLQRFQFHLSPGYKHSPATFVTLQPEHGMQIILEPC
ncbi:hypothetical protein L7F22_053642 [Adiantum nelumboides]|nr:hypothetical protein [Adiantum nelumboides]